MWCYRGFGICHGQRVGLDAGVSGSGSWEGFTCCLEMLFTITEVSISYKRFLSGLRQAAGLVSGSL